LTEAKKLHDEKRTEKATLDHELAVSGNELLDEISWWSDKTKIWIYIRTITILSNILCRTMNPIQSLTNNLYCQADILMIPCENSDLIIFYPYYRYRYTYLERYWVYLRYPDIVSQCMKSKGRFKSERETNR
jgi:hypothetical protein